MLLKYDICFTPFSLPPLLTHHNANPHPYPRLPFPTQLGNLTIVRLPGNSLTTVPVGVIVRLRKLEVLDLSFNLIEAIPDDIDRLIANERLTDLRMHDNK